MRSLNATRTWSLRQGATLAHTTRAVARAVAGDGLIPTSDLTDVDVVALRALAPVRTLLFSGEAQPANAPRITREREQQLAATVRDLYAEQAPVDACALVFAEEVLRATETGGLITTIVDAHKTGRQYLVLPIGVWLREQENAAGGAERPGVEGVLDTA